MSEELFAWRDEYSIGLNTIDEQHKKLIRIINDLLVAMKSGKGKEVVGSAIDNLLSYTNEHFGFEEKVFARINYPEVSEHLNLHKSFVDKIKGFKVDHEAGKILLSMQIMNFLKDWLVKHIQGTDTRYVDDFKKAGIN